MLEGDSFSAPPLFLFFLFFQLFCFEAVGPFLIQSRRVFFFSSFSRQKWGEEVGSFSRFGGGRQDF